MMEQNRSLAIAVQVKDWRDWLVYDNYQANAI